MNKEIQGIFFLILLSVLAFVAYSQTNVLADSNIVPLYRLYNKDGVDHMYTSNSTEADLAERFGYVKQGIIAYVYSSQVAGTVPLYQLYSLNEVDHMYTADIKEHNTALFYSGYADEGITGYVYLLPPTPSTTNPTPSTSSTQLIVQEKMISMPQWIKNTAEWWADGKTTDQKFLIGISFLAKAQFVTTPISAANVDDKIPNWVRNVASFWAANEISDNEFRDAIQYLLQTDVIEISKQTLDTVDSEGLRIVYYRGYSPLFTTFSYAKDSLFANGKNTFLTVYFDLRPELADTYSQIAIWDKPHSAVVVVPLFTSTAYWEPGFYTYYRGECDTRCLTKKIEFDRPSTFSGSHNGLNVLKLLGYDTITDVDIDKNPQILKRYDKLIILHSEYVTKKEFDAITHHPKVIYLYANPLYAEVSYHNDTITLIKGHGYPTQNITNAFGWKFDNSKYEYDTDCLGKSFYKVDNGLMLDCYPSNVIFRSKTLLQIIKDY